ncbi:MAG: 6-bladed beta-propeller [Bacteroidaceae bacterium]|nr:6-bladed beta-propeller [Bacteroidaceae bacterium]
MRRFVCYPFLSVLLFLSVSCSNKQSGPGGNEIYVDFENGSPTVVNTPDDLFNYSNYLDTVLYIQLETSDNCLIGEVNDIHFVNDRLFVQADFKSVFVFDLNGKLISKVSRVGRGPGEYGKLAWFDVNPTNNEISIYDVSNRKICVYSLQGDFIRQFNIRYLSDFCVLPNGNYLFYNPSYMKNHYRGVWQTDPEGNYINQPLVLSGSARQEVGESHYLMHINKDVVGVMGPMGFDNIYHISADTSEIAYQIKTSESIPDYVLKGEFEGYLYEQDFYLLLRYNETESLVTFDMSNTKKSMIVKYDKNTGKVYTDLNKGNYPFLPGDKVLLSLEPRRNDYGVGLDYITADNIMMLPEDYINKIAPGCTIDSNPVVCLYYYKMK